jgi:hypothetical protein
VVKIRIELAAKEAEKIAERKRISSMANASMFEAVLAERDEDIERASLLKFQKEQQSKKDEQMLQLQKHDFKLLLEQRQKMRDLQQLHERESAVEPIGHNVLLEGAVHSSDVLQDYRADNAENVFSSAEAQSLEPDLQPTHVLLVETRETDFRPSETQEPALQSSQPPVQEDALSECLQPPRDELALIRDEQELLLLTQPYVSPGHQENLHLLPNESVTVVSTTVELSSDLISDVDDYIATSHAILAPISVLQASDTVRSDELGNAVHNESVVELHPQVVGGVQNPEERQQAHQCDDNHRGDAASSESPIPSQPLSPNDSHSIDDLDAAALMNVDIGQAPQPESKSSVSDISSQNEGHLSRVDGQHLPESENSEVEASPLPSSAVASALGAEAALQQNGPELCTAPIRHHAFVSDNQAPACVGVESPLLTDNTSATTSFEGNTSAASSLEGNTSAALSLEGNTSAALSLEGNTSAALSLEGNTSAALSLEDNSLAASSLEDNSLAASSLEGNTLAASSLEGNTSAASSFEGNTLAASSLEGNTLAALEELVAGTAAAATLESRHMITDYLTILTQLNTMTSDNQITGVLQLHESQSRAENVSGAPATNELQSVDIPFTSDTALIDASAVHNATVEVCGIATQAVSSAPQPTQAAAADHDEREFADISHSSTSFSPPFLDNIGSDSTMTSTGLPSVAVVHAALELDTLNSGSLARSESAPQLVQQGSASTVVSHIASLEQKNCLSPDELREAIALNWEQALSDSSGSVGQLKQLWRSADDGNGKLSLAELDTWFMRKYRNWYNKSVIKQAFSISKNANGFIRFSDFGRALVNIIRCLLAWADFDRANQAYDVKRTDSGGKQAKDHRLEYKEFKVYFLATFAGSNEAACKREWRMLDADGKGMVLFGEFCNWHILKASMGFKAGLDESRKADCSPDNLHVSSSGVGNNAASVSLSSCNDVPSNESTVQPEAEANRVAPDQQPVHFASEIRTSSHVLETPSLHLSVPGAESAAECQRSDTKPVGPTATQEDIDAAPLCEVSSTATVLLPERTDDDNSCDVLVEVLHQSRHDDDELRLAKAEIENLKAEISRLNSQGSRDIADRDPELMLQNALSGASPSSVPSPRACMLPAIRDTLLQVTCSIAFFFHPISRN